MLSKDREYMFNQVCFRLSLDSRFIIGVKGMLDVIYCDHKHPTPPIKLIRQYNDVLAVVFLRICAFQKYI